MGDLPDENEMRFVAVLNRKAPIGSLFNALGHMAAGLAGGSGQAENMCFLEYRDADGGVHPHISHYPFIVLKADNSNKLRTLRRAALERGILMVDFTSTMTVGTSEEQLNRTAAAAEEDLEYYGVC